MLKKDIKNKKKLFLATEILVIYRIALKRYIKIIFEITKNIEKKPVEIIFHKIKNDASILSLTMSLYYSIENFLQSYQAENYDMCWSNIDYWICRKYFGKYIIRYQFISDAFLIVKNLKKHNLSYDFDSLLDKEISRIIENIFLIIFRKITNLHIRILKISKFFFFETKIHKNDQNLAYLCLVNKLRNTEINKMTFDNATSLISKKKFWQIILRNYS